MHEVLTTSVVLSSDVPLDAAPAISAPHGVIRVELTLSQPVAEYYDVALMTIAGDSVFSANGLKRLESETIGFHVPSDAVPPGDYQVNLLRIDGESKQNAGTYYFHVR